MFAALDQNIQKFFKGFYSTQPGQYEDPTYLGFSFQFQFNPTHRNPSTGFTDDALFADPGAGLDSAQYYLQAIGYPNRALMLKQFKQQLQYINDSTPWYFQTLEGLADIWDIPWGRDGWNNYRGKDKRLTISCMESIDLRITALADLYRKATVDPLTMRSLLPDNLRWFTLTVRVHEIRKFQKVADAATALGNVSLGNALNPAFGNLANGINNQPGAPLPVPNRAQMMDVLNLISMVTFEFSKCEFDFNQSFPVQDAINMGTADMSMAKSVIKIDTHHISETSHYKLLDLVLRDGTFDRSQVGGSYFSNSNVTSSNSVGSIQQTIPDFDSSLNPGTGWSPIASRVNSMIAAIGNPLANAVGAASNAVQAAITRAVLGNVYDLSNQSLSTILGTLTGNGQNNNVPPLTHENALSNTPPNPAPLAAQNVLSSTPSNPAPLSAENALVDTPPNAKPLGPENVFK